MSAPTPALPAIRHLMTIDIDGLPPYELGETPLGRRRIVPVGGGRFFGGLDGVVMPGGGDWALLRRDGSFVPDVRLILKCEDGTLVSLTYGGRWTAAPGDMKRLLKREGDLAAISFRWWTACQFECASDSPQAWLNGIMAIGRGMPRAGGVTYEIFELQ